MSKGPKWVVVFSYADGVPKVYRSKKQALKDAALKSTLYSCDFKLAQIGQWQDYFRMGDHHMACDDHD